jgi:hypothetical protein
MEVSLETSLYASDREVGRQVETQALSEVAISAGRDDGKDVEEGEEPDDPDDERQMETDLHDPYPDMGSHVQEIIPTSAGWARSFHRSFLILPAPLNTQLQCVRLISDRTS